MRSLLPLKSVLCLLLVQYTYSVVISVSPDGSDHPSCFMSEANPCATLDYALTGAQQHDNVSLLLNGGPYLLFGNRTVTTFKNMVQIHLVGIGEIVRIHCTDSGLSFLNSSNIGIVNIAFSNCGLIQNSSSSSQKSTSTQTVFKKFIVGIYFLLCSNVTLERISVSETPGVGVVLYSTGGVNQIIFSNFSNNTIGNDGTGGGGMAIEFLYCIPGDAKCSDGNPSHIPTNNYQDVTFHISNCSFEDNTGNSTNDSSAFIIPYSNHNVALGRGGGLGVVFKGQATRNILSIESCVFHNNTAIWGGGALVEFQDSAHDNKLLIHLTRFVNNVCEYHPCDYKGTGGGGLRILFAGFNTLLTNNTVLITNAVFRRNSAYFGGGTSIMTFPEVNQTSNKVKFESVTWERNKARLGSAVDLSVWHLTLNGSVIRPLFEECSFLWNTVHYTDYLGTAKGEGTIYADTVPIAFSGLTNFFGNIGSCIYSVEADIEFLEGTNAYFEANKADNGGGIALHGNSYLQMYDGSVLVFLNNIAVLYGGAIYWQGVGSRFLISSRNCFIRYKDYLLDPEQWPVEFVFDQNVAGVSGHDIYGSSLLGCLWGGKPYGEFIIEEEEYRKVFNWNSTIWQYLDPRNDSIATAPGHFSLNNQTMCSFVVAYKFNAMPGGYAHFDIEMLNDRFTPSDSVVFSAVFNENPADNKSISVQYLSSAVNISVPGYVGEYREYNISTLYPRIISSKVILKFENCPFGFNFNPERRACVGSSFPFIRTHENFTTSVQRGFWIGNLSMKSDGKDENHTVTSQCFFCPFSNHYTGNYILLPNENVNEYLCAGLQRTGDLCGECQNGYAPAVSSEHYTCVKCSEDVSRYSWILYIIGKFVPTTIVLCLVIIFNISVTSGPANSFVLFAQVISTTFSVNAGQALDYSSIVESPDIFRKVYMSVYSLWNLDFFESIEVGLYCLGPNVVTLHLLALKYVTAVYPLLILLLIAILLALYDRSNKVVVCLLKPVHRLFARCVRIFNFDLNRSIMDAFATFLVLSYVKFAVTAALLLYPNPLYGEDGHVIKYVSFFDPSKYYASWQYAPYIAVSLVVFLCICLFMPIVLFLYSLRPFYAFLEKRRLNFLLPGEKFNYFLNSFYHCYKDGTNEEHDRRYFASFYFFARLILIFSYSFAIDWVIQYIIQQTICTVIIVVISTFQPYKNHFFNIVDSTMFALLAVINILTIYQNYLAVANFKLSAPCFYVQLLLIFLPFIYIVSIVVYHRVRKHCVKKRRHPGDEAQFSFGEFMEDVQNEGRFHQVNYYAPLQEEQRLAEATSTGTTGNQVPFTGSAPSVRKNKRLYFSAKSSLHSKRKSRARMTDVGDYRTFQS